MPTTSASTRLIAAIVLVLLLLRGSEVVAQQPNTAAAAACYATCEIYWSALQNETRSSLQFLAQYQNSTQKAADYYCSSIATISACLSACKELHSQVVYESKTSIMSLVTTQSPKCFTDEAKCRIKDSELWCNTYVSSFLCGDKATSYEECLIGVQALRGCHLTNPTYKSQRMFLATLMDNALYCLNNHDFFLLPPDIGHNAQTCVQYIPEVCLSSITGPEIGSYNPYYMGNATCGNIESIKNCMEATLTQTIMLQGREYTRMCQSVPNSAAEFPRLLNIVDSLLPCSQTTSVNQFTSVTVPTTDVVTVKVAENMTTTTQNSTTSAAPIVACTHSSGMTTDSSLVKVLLSTVIAVVLTCLIF